MICSNCGFRNEAGDEFCGSCGKFLEFTGASQNADGQAGLGAQAGVPPPIHEPAPDSPTTVQPVVPPIPAPTPRAAAGSAPMGRAPDVICWNCERRNPAGRAFCMQCGTKLNTDNVAGPAVASGVTYRRPLPDEAASGGGGRRTLAVGAGLLALLVLAGVVGAIFLGVLGGPGPTPGLVAGVSPSPSAGASASFPAASASFGATPLTSFGVFPTAPLTTGLITFPPPSEPPITPRPTKTPRPTCDPGGAPRGCRPSPQPSPTAQPTPANCLSSTQADRSITLTRDFPMRTIPAGFAWCVYDITFTNLSNPGATGTLKLYLENPEFIGPPGNYGMAKIGWPGPAEANIASDFSSSPEYHPLWDYPEGYDVIPGETTVSFEIVNCGTPGTCNGSVTIEVERIEAP